MSTHRFILEPYKGVCTRHTCPNCHRKRCFSKYIDTEKRIQFPVTLGVVTTSRNVGIISRPVITLNGIRMRRESCPRITFGTMRL